MQIDPRLEQIDDSLYRVAVRALIIQNNKVLAVKEVDGGDWWAIPGGGVNYGESLEQCLIREVGEELGVSEQFIKSDFQIIYCSIGKVVNGVPRMNVYYRVDIAAEELRKTDDVDKWAWLSQTDFMNLDMNPSYNKTELAEVIFAATTEVRTI